MECNDTEKVAEKVIEKVAQTAETVGYAGSMRGALHDGAANGSSAHARVAAPTRIRTTGSVNLRAHYHGLLITRCRKSAPVTAIRQRQRPNGKTLRRC